MGWLGGRGVNIQNRQTGRRSRWERLPSSSQTNTCGDRQLQKDKSKLISCLMSSLPFVKQLVDTMTMITTTEKEQMKICSLLSSSTADIVWNARPAVRQEFTGLSSSLLFVQIINYVGISTIFITDNRPLKS